MSLASSSSLRHIAIVDHTPILSIFLMNDINGGQWANLGPIKNQKIKNNRKSVQTMLEPSSCNAPAGANRSLLFSCRKTEPNNKQTIRKLQMYILVIRESWDSRLCFVMPSSHLCIRCAEICVLPPLFFCILIWLVLPSYLVQLGFHYYYY